MVSQSTVGGWTDWNFQLSAAAKQVLEQVTSGLLGATYTGLAFSSQLVNGTNYAFLCQCTASTEPPNVGPVVLHAYAPRDGKPLLTSIVRLGPVVNNLPGGFGSWAFPPSAGELEVFQRALAKLVGVGYDAMGATTQVVAGANYCFLAKATGVYPGAATSPALLSIFQPLKGAPQIQEINLIPPWPNHAQERAAE